jgi:hypothetical protein
MNDMLTNTADAYKKAHDALKDAELALKQVRATLEEQYEAHGVTRHTTSDGTVIAVVEVNTREFDLDALRMVAPNAFEKVTALKVDTKAFDKQVRAGEITNEAVAEVVTYKPHKRVEVGVAQ